MANLVGRHFLYMYTVSWNLRKAHIQLLYKHCISNLHKQTLLWLHGVLNDGMKCSRYKDTRSGVIFSIVCHLHVLVSVIYWRATESSPISNCSYNDYCYTIINSKAWYLYAFFMWPMINELSCNKIVPSCLIGIWSCNNISASIFIQQCWMM